MTYSLAYTSSVNYDSSNYGTVLTEFCQTWLANRGWNVTPQTTQPDSGFYSWHCEKNVTLQDGTTKRFGKVIGADVDFLFEGSWASGDPVANSNRVAMANNYENYSLISTSDVSGQWKMYTDDTDGDTFLLAIGGEARVFWPPSGATANYVAYSSYSDMSTPIWDEEPALTPNNSNYCVFSVNSSSFFTLNACSSSAYTQAAAPVVYEFAGVRGNSDQNIFFDTSGLVGMYESGGRYGAIDTGLNTLFVSSTSTYYIRVGSGSNSGSVLLNHGSINPNL